MRSTLAHSARCKVTVRDLAKNAAWMRCPSAVGLQRDEERREEITDVEEELKGAGWNDWMYESDLQKVSEVQRKTLAVFCGIKNRLERDKVFINFLLKKHRIL